MAKEEKNKITFCPNCQQPAIRQGNEITCEACDATFTITKKDGAKVKQIGRIELLEQDVAALKAKVSGEELEPKENVGEGEGEGEDQDEDSNNSESW